MLSKGNEALNTKIDSQFEIATVEWSSIRLQFVKVHKYAGSSSSRSSSRTSNLNGNWFGRLGLRPEVITCELKGRPNKRMFGFQRKKTQSTIFVSVPLIQILIDNEEELWLVAVANKQNVSLPPCKEALIAFPLFAPSSPVLATPADSLSHDDQQLFGEPVWPEAPSSLNK